LYETILNIDAVFWDFFHLEDQNEEYHFELLRKGYVEARYDKNYRINLEETRIIEERVLFLLKTIKKLCQKMLKWPWER
jgi:hypothetical protein